MFFEFRQNNSGGTFVYDEQKGISHSVIVEADSKDDAITRAEQIGLYFDGEGDCPCCGDRWSTHIEGYNEPRHYDELLENINVTSRAMFGARNMWKWIDGYQVFIHFANGVIEGYGCDDGPLLSTAMVIEVDSREVTGQYDA